MFPGQDTRIWGLLPWGEAVSSPLGPPEATAYLIITAEKGMFVCASRRTEPACTPFSPGLTDLLAASRPYHATMLPEGILAIGTRGGGVLLVDEAGRLLRILNEASGLRDENVKYTYVDRQGGLWLALNNGLARVEVDTALSYYDKKSGLPGNVPDVVRHQGRLYAATSLGVYSLEPAAEGAAPRFLPSAGILGQCWSLLPTPQGLLAGCQGGVYNVDDQQLIWPLDEGHVLQLYRSRRDTALLYLGLSGGLARLHLRAGQWTDAGRIDGVREHVWSIVDDAQGRLWMGGSQEGVFRLEAATALSDEPVARDPVISRFGVDGLSRLGTPSCPRAHEATSSRASTACRCRTKRWRSGSWCSRPPASSPPIRDTTTRCSISSSASIRRLRKGRASAWRW